MDLKRTVLLNTHFNNLTINEVLHYIDDCIIGKSDSHIVSLNVDQIIKIEGNKNFQTVMNEAELSLVDGTPLVWISKLFNKKVAQKMPGPYLAEKILLHASSKGYKVFLLGAKEGVAERASVRMTKKYKGLDIVGVYSPPYGFENDINEIEHMNCILKKSAADILIVGLGAPKQEEYVHNNKKEYKIPVSLSLGAAIDFMAGEVKRAPKWINKIGMELFYRFLLEPKRLFKRYFVDDMKILKLVFKYRS